MKRILRSCLRNVASCLSSLRLADLSSRTVRDGVELLPRSEVDNIFVSGKFKTRFPDFRVTTFREGLTAIRDGQRAATGGTTGG